MNIVFRGSVEQLDCVLIDSFDSSAINEANELDEGRRRNVRDFCAFLVVFLHVCLHHRFKDSRANGENALVDGNFFTVGSDQSEVAELLVPEKFLELLAHRLWNLRNLDDLHHVESTDNFQLLSLEITLLTVACSEFSVVEQLAKALVWTPIALELDFSFALPRGFICIVVAIRNANLVEEAELSLSSAYGPAFREIARKQGLVLLESQSAENRIISAFDLIFDL